MARVSIRRRAVIALVGYGVLALSALVFVFLRRNTPTLATTQVLILSAVWVAPIVLALLWEHLKGVKLGQVEISLNEVAPTPNVELATEIQRLEASVTPALSAAMRAAVKNRGFKLVEINLQCSLLVVHTTLSFGCARRGIYAYRALRIPGTGCGALVRRYGCTHGCAKGACQEISRFAKGCSGRFNRT
jgi:hypothetical protein